MVQIKPVTTTAIPLLRDIAIESYSDHYLHLWHDGGAWYIEKCFGQNILETEFNDSNSSFFLVYYKEILAGFLKLNKDAAWENINSTEGLELERIYLLKRFSGKGIGKHLVKFTFELAREYNKKIVWLKAMDSSQEAIAFYNKMGFEICGKTRLEFEQMKSAYRGMVVMKYLVSP